MRRDPAVLFLAIGQTLAWASIYYVFPALLLRWEQETGWSKTELTAAITLAVLISAAASPLAGRVIDWGHGPTLTAISSLLGGAGLLALSAVSELWQFYVVWAFIGLAMAGCLYEPIFALVTRARGAKARHGIIFITLIAGFASTISFPVVHTLSDLLGWRGTAQIGAAVMVFLVTPSLWTGVRLLERGSSEPTRPSRSAETAKTFLRRPAFWFLALGFATVAITHGATLHHLLPILDERGLSPELAVFAASFIGPMQVAGRLAMMASERYLTNNAVALLAFACLGLSIVLLSASAASPALLTAFVILFGGSYGTVSILRPLLAREILGQASFGAKSGALAVPYLAASAAAPFVGALIWSLGGYDLMLGLACGSVIIGGGLYWCSFRLADAGS